MAGVTQVAATVCKSIYCAFNYLTISSLNKPEKTGIKYYGKQNILHGAHDYLHDGLNNGSWILLQPQT